MPFRARLSRVLGTGLSNFWRCRRVLRLRHRQPTQPQLGDQRDGPCRLDALGVVHLDRSVFRASVCIAHVQAEVMLVLGLNPQPLHLGSRRAHFYSPVGQDFLERIANLLGVRTRERVRHLEMQGLPCSQRVERDQERKRDRDQPTPTPAPGGTDVGEPEQRTPQPIRAEASRSDRGSQKPKAPDGRCRGGHGVKTRSAPGRGR